MTVAQVRKYRPKPGQPLSPRERELVVRLTALDEPIVQRAAQDVGVTPGTAVSYLKRAYVKLGVRSRLGLLRRLIELGLVGCPCGCAEHAQAPEEDEDA